MLEPLNKHHGRRRPPHLLRGRADEGHQAVRVVHRGGDAEKGFGGSRHHDHRSACIGHAGAVASLVVEGESVRGVLDGRGPDAVLCQPPDQINDHGRLPASGLSHDPNHQRAQTGRGNRQPVTILRVVEHERCDARSRRQRRSPGGHQDQCVGAEERCEIAGRPSHKEFSRGAPRSARPHTRPECSGPIGGAGEAGGERDVHERPDRVAPPGQPHQERARHQVKGGQAGGRGARQPHHPRVPQPPRKEWAARFEVDPPDDPLRAEVEPGAVDGVVPADRDAAGRQDDVVLLP